MFMWVQPRPWGPMDQPSLPFTITHPTGEPGPVVLSSPHSGRVYPRAILDRLQVDGPTLLALDDGPIDKLGQPACEAGAVLIAARYPRVVVDLNREPDELDPDLVADPDAMAELRVTARARAGGARPGSPARPGGGLGAVPSGVGGRALWRGRLDAGELKRRLEQVFDPYHAQIESLLRERRERQGIAVLLDCHSMPGIVAAAEPPVDAALGDRFGRSCGGELVAAAEGPPRPPRAPAGGARRPPPR